MSAPNPWDEARTRRQPPPPVDVRGSYEPHRAGGADPYGGPVDHGRNGHDQAAYTDVPRGRDELAWADRPDLHDPGIWVDHGAPGPRGAYDPQTPPPPPAGPGADPWATAAPTADDGWVGYDDEGYSGYEGQAGDAYLSPDEVPAPWMDGDDGQPGRREQRRAHLRQEAQAREQRWQRNRLAVPYSIDGPKVSLGLAWFALAVVAIVAAPLAIGLVASSVAALAGLQTAHAWYPGRVRTKWWTAAAAFCTGMCGVLAKEGVLVGVVLGTVVLLVHVALEPQRNRTVLEQLDIALRSALPVGVAAGSLAGLRTIGLGPTVLLVVLVSAYEVGDFLVGTGSKNAVEGPVAGLIAVVAVGFVGRVLAPAPFTTTSVVLFAALAGVCCPLGQILAAALLPRGSAWAPALRRLDSYLLAAPLWLLLLGSVKASVTL